MTGKKPSKTRKKVSKTKKISNAKPVKKTTKKTTIKTRSPKKGMKTSANKPGKVALKGREIKTKKKDVKKKTIVKTVTKKVPTKKTEAKTAKKLSPRLRRIQDIKKRLIMQRNALLNEAEEALNELPGQTIFPDMGDQASAEIDRSFMLRLRGREQRLLKKIEAAIEKIDNTLFGICDVCGEEIDIKRLEARPVTNMCIFCKTEQEEEEKMRGA